MSVPSALALVPARSGSTRVPGKNVRPLAGHPLIAYAIAAAHESGVFDAVVVSTDSPTTAEIARHYGAEVLELRPPDLAGPTSPDIAWIEHVLGVLGRAGRCYDAFSILRPTSPFRGADTVRRAWARFLEHGERIDSLRAVELCRQHPGKMWVVHGDDLMSPLLAQPEELPFHSRQYAALPKVHVQNSSIEIAWTRVASENSTIAGRRIAPFFTEPIEGFSIDYPDDWEAAERLAETREGALPRIENAPFAAAGTGA
jgi:CMP-N,N'-diacetyllegionaminic acid synthase